MNSRLLFAGDDFRSVGQFFVAQQGQRRMVVEEGRWSDRHRVSDNESRITRTIFTLRVFDYVRVDCWRA